MEFKSEESSVSCEQGCSDAQRQHERRQTSDPELLKAPLGPLDLHQQVKDLVVDLHQGRTEDGVHRPRNLGRGEEEEARSNAAALLTS